MIRDLLKRPVDFKKDDSLITSLRRKRIALFKELSSDIQKPLRIIDVGGTVLFWEKMNFVNDEHYDITVLNRSAAEKQYVNIKSVIGDARNMSEFRDGEFDIVFSNSVIEHVGRYEEQCQMAEEVKRIGKRYFIQTPNFHFPFEPHFLFPFFQFFPLWLKVFMLRHFSLGWYNKVPDKQEATKIAASIRLLRKRDLEKLFPDGIIYNEKLFGFTISFIVYGGW